VRLRACARENERERGGGGGGGGRGEREIQFIAVFFHVDCLLMVLESERERTRV
jgi:hypothetical protein